MRKLIAIFLSILPFLTLAQIQPLDQSMRQKVLAYTWHSGCPVAPSALRLLIVRYWGLDQRIHQGQLVVNADIAKNLEIIFKQLLQIHFAFNKIVPLEQYLGNEDQAMTDNDTFVFNCRAITGNRHVFSWHAYGTAIDINPVFNPYIRQNLILPPNGRLYINRNRSQPGLIHANSRVVNIFLRQGWQWGGDWYSLKDYQHFEIAHLQ